MTHEETFDRLIALAASLNAYIDEARKYDAGAANHLDTPGKRPGDAFNARGSWSEILEPHGWRPVGGSGGKTYWRRPDRDAVGWSATTGHCRSEITGDLLYIFSSNAHPFEAEKCYSKFSAFAMLNHGGDFVAAATALAAQGFGEKSKRSRAQKQVEPNSSMPVSQQSVTSSPIIIRASAVKLRAVEWLWPGRIPIGKLTTFAGAGGIGKTFTLCDLSARISSGLELPFAAGEMAVKGQVLFLSGEDDPEDTLVPRLLECGADLERICFLKNAVQDFFTLGDLDILDRAIEEVGAGVRLVIFDPPTSFLGDVDDHKNSELRRLLSPLKSWAARHQLSVILNTHINKAHGTVEAASRVIGSVAWVNAVRAAHMFARDPEDQARRLFCLFKQNLGPERPALAYRLVATERLARVEWIGEVETTADDALAKKTDKATQRCINTSGWLIDRFREKLEWRSDDLFAAAKNEGISRNAVFEAKTAMNLPRARKITHMNGNTEWIWWVPADWVNFGTASLDTLGNYESPFP